MISISERPPEVEDGCSRDTGRAILIGRTTEYAIGTLWSGTSRYVTALPSAFWPRGWGRERAISVGTRSLRGPVAVMTGTGQGDGGTTSASGSLPGLPIYSATRPSLGSAAPNENTTGCCVSTFQRDRPQRHAPGHLDSLPRR